MQERGRDRNEKPTRGRLWVIAAPSGAGKTSLVRKLLERDRQLRFSISYTTRQKRDRNAPDIVAKVDALTDADANWRVRLAFDVSSDS